MTWQAGLKSLVHEYINSEFLQYIAITKTCVIINLYCGLSGIW